MQKAERWLLLVRRANMWKSGSSRTHELISVFRDEYELMRTSYCSSCLLQVTVPVGRK